jgi:hypothetical protein
MHYHVLCSACVCGVFIWNWQEGNWLANYCAFQGGGTRRIFLTSCGGTKQNLDEMRVPHKYETQKVHIPSPINGHARDLHAHLTSRSFCSRRLQTVGALTTHFYPIRVIIAYILLPLAMRRHLVGDSQTRPAELVGRHKGCVFCSLTINMTGWADQPETDSSPWVPFVASSRLVGKIHDDIPSGGTMQKKGEEVAEEGGHR